MTDADRVAVQRQLIRHEGIRYSAYQDSRGLWTIGCGRLIDARKGGRLSHAEVLVLLDNDIATCVDDLATFPWFAGLDVMRQCALIDMRFQLGGGGFRGFRQMVAALERQDIPAAVAAARDSQWAREDTPERARAITHQLDTGEEAA